MNTANIAALPPPDPQEKITALESALSLAEKKNFALEGQIEQQKLHLAELQSNTFNYTLQNLDAGSVLEKLDEELRGLGEAVKRLHGKGALTLTLTLSPSTTRAYSMEATIKSPRRKRSPPPSSSSTTTGNSPATTRTRRNSRSANSPKIRS